MNRPTVAETPAPPGFVWQASDQMEPLAHLVEVGRSAAGRVFAACGTYFWREPAEPDCRVCQNCSRIAQKKNGGI